VHQRNVTVSALLAVVGCHIQRPRLTPPEVDVHRERAISRPANLDVVAAG
jgi:hypothetical protein